MYWNELTFDGCNHTVDYIRQSSLWRRRVQEPRHVSSLVTKLTNGQARVQRTMKYCHCPSVGQLSE
jgi:hypothetical protein